MWAVGATAGTLVLSGWGGRGRALAAVILVAIGVAVWRRAGTAVAPRAQRPALIAAAFATSVDAAFAGISAPTLAHGGQGLSWTIGSLTSISTLLAVFLGGAVGKGMDASGERMAALALFGVAVHIALG